MHPKAARYSPDRQYSALDAEDQKQVPVLSRSTPLSRLVMIGTLGIVALIWLWLLQYFRLTPIYGEGWKDFWAAGWVLVHGGNPYDPATLWQAQNALFNRPHHLHPGNLTYFYQDYYFNPPLFAWLLARIFPTGGTTGFGSAYLLWCVLLSICAVAATWRLATDLGWRHTKSRVVAIIGLAATTWWFYVLWSGEQSSILWLSIVMATSTLLRGKGISAGLWISLGWLKPHLVLPLLPILWFLCANKPTERRALLIGFLGGTLLWVVATALTTGLVSLSWWFHWLLHYSNVVGQVQSDLPSLGGLLLITVPHSWPLVAVLALLAILVGWQVWRRLLNTSLSLPADIGSATTTLPQRRRLIGVQVTLVLWLIVFPYSHQNDDIMLWGSILVLVGHEGYRLVANSKLSLLLVLLVVVAPVWRLLVAALALPLPATGVAAIPLVVLAALLWRNVLPGSSRALS